MDDVEQMAAQAGQRIRELRQQEGWSLDGLAERCGVSRSMLSEIERGQANPTLLVALRIAGAFEISLSDLVEEQMPVASIDVVRSRESRYVFRQDEDCEIRTLSPLELEKDVEFYHVKLSSGGKIVSPPHYAGTREFLTVNKGKVGVVSDDAHVTLGAGDSATYRADLSHAIINEGRGEASIFLVVIYS